MGQTLQGDTHIEVLGRYEAKTHFPRLLSQVEKCESTKITRRGRPVAVLSPAEQVPERDINAVLAKFRAYDHERDHNFGSLSIREIKDLTKQGRP